METAGRSCDDPHVRCMCRCFGALVQCSAISVAGRADDGRDSHDCDGATDACVEVGGQNTNEAAIELLP